MTRKGNQQRGRAFRSVYRTLDLTFNSGMKPRALKGFARIVCCVFIGLIEGVEDGDVIDPSGYQSLCEELNIDLDGVHSLEISVILGNAIYALLELSSCKSFLPYQRRVDTRNENIKVLINIV